MIQVEINNTKLEFNTESEFQIYLLDNNLKLDSDGSLYVEMGVGVIPAILDQWFKERVEYRNLAKKFADEGDKSQSEFYGRRQLRQKIFLNSVYGVLGLPIFRFYDRDNAEAVTMSGKMIIHAAEKVVNDYINAQSNTNVDHIIYADTDSNYFSIELLAKKENISSENMVEFAINKSSEICDKINRLYDYMIPFIFNVTPLRNRIRIIPDVIAKKALWVAKKRYAMLKVYDMEKHKSVSDKLGNVGKLEVKGIDTVRSSYPAAFRKFAAELLDSLLRGVSREILNERIMSFEESIDGFSIYEMAKTSSVKYISKSGDKDYNPAIRRPFQFMMGSPAQVRAALAYNDLLKVWELEKFHEKIMNGAKVKWVYLLPNDFFIDQLAMKADDTDPDKILDFITENIDRKKIYERELHGKMEEIWNVIGWEYPRRATVLAMKTFDFSESW